MNKIINQKTVFSSSEGDSWFDRNKSIDMSSRISEDLIIKEIERLNLTDMNCLEIGCADGWRLNTLNIKFKFNCYGIDPSEKAIKSGESQYQNLNLIKGTADNLPYKDNSMSIIIIGFCLYLCDRSDLFKIASEVNRVLVNNGIVVILDFYTETPYKNKYAHLDGVYSYKMDYEKMFSWNPEYQLISKSITSHNNDLIVDEKDERLMICALRKSVLDSYSEKPRY
ncbi:MAG: class I SAM-dependent methyltransferase [Bermanella sp.]